MRPDVALANHLVMGPVVLARALDDVPYAVKVHGSALEYTVKPHPERFLPYAREGLARPARCWSARATRPRACGRRWTTPGSRPARSSARRASTSREFRPREPDAAREGPEALVRAAARDAPAGEDGLLLRARPARGRRGARHDRARGPPRRLRRQADRLQGRRPAARRLAARARARAGRQARDRRLRRVPGGRAGGARRATLRRAATCAARTGCELQYLRAFLESAPRGLPGGRRARRVGGAARPRRARRPAARHRGDGRPQHVPRGVRDGRRRGRRVRLAARGGAPLRARRRSRRRSPRSFRRRRGRCWASSAAPTR